ncbi:hypothetical protein NL64_23270 [Pseudomonas fluorescens]|nr:hypothetical protein NL64_23270 [Pseudomonas fluorescens]
MEHPALQIQLLIISLVTPLSLQLLRERSWQSMIFMWTMRSMEYFCLIEITLIRACRGFCIMVSIQTLILKM